MGVDCRVSAFGRAVLGCALALLAAGCGQTPLKPSPVHIQAQKPAPEGAIPAPVQVVPVLPPPTAAPRAETYTVVVNNVRVQDLLFALARDAKLNVDIHAGVQGSVTLNAIDQTLPQILNRISKQVDMRYEIDGPTLSVMRDTPYLRVYRIDYVNLARDTTNQANLST
jgi:general secretion pathway protein D